MSRVKFEPAVTMEIPMSRVRFEPGHEGNTDESGEV